MSTDKGRGISSQKETSIQSAPKPPTTQTSIHPAAPDTPAKSESGPAIEEHDRKPASIPEQTSGHTSPSTPEAESNRPRQVIAVSASKGPTAFFNLARKFLVTDEMCDLSALEGAIVSAVDAAHLLERSKLATIVRVQTSYVTVEPKRKKPPGSPLAQPSHPPSLPQTDPGAQATAAHFDTSASPSPSLQRGGRSSGRELRRARIVITVKRTESYKKWLEENPLQAIMAGDGAHEEDGSPEATNP